MLCADVTWEMGGTGQGSSWTEAEPGDLLWNPKMGEGHVLVADVPCGSFVGGRRVACDDCLSSSCRASVLVCQCGETYRDHHYFVLAKAAP